MGRDRPFQFAIQGPTLGKYVRDRASLIVANSHTSAAALDDADLNDVLRVVPNGIDLSRFSSRGGTAGHDATAGKRKIVVGLVANLSSKVKKGKLFLEAAARVKSHSVEFHVFGHLPAGSELNDLQQLIERLGLSTRLQLRGFIDDPTAIMSSIDVLMHTADQESFGRILVEAMAASLPVVAPRGGGAAEIVVDGETGFLATPNDAADLARAVERLAGDVGLRGTMGAAGRRRSEQLYDVRRCINQMIDVYAEALERPVARLGSSGPIA